MAELNAPILLEPYSAAWPVRFEAERQLLEGILASWLAGPIEHIGSTAVPGMTAKPIVDVMAGVRDLQGSKEAISILESAQYCYAPYRTAVMHWFCKPSPSFRMYHLHLVPFGSPTWTERLIFRDRLRRDQVTATAYLGLKFRLAQSHPTDREAYTDGKAEFVSRVIQEESQAAAQDSA